MDLKRDNLILQYSNTPFRSPASAIYLSSAQSQFRNLPVSVQKA